MHTPGSVASGQPNLPVVQNAQPAHSATTAEPTGGAPLGVSNAQAASSTSGTPQSAQRAPYEPPASQHFMSPAIQGASPSN